MFSALYAFSIEKLAGDVIHRSGVLVPSAYFLALASILKLKGEK